MANKFKFNIITGENAGEKYAAIANKEPFTFYLLQTGVGYLGTVKLFDASTIKDSDTEVTGKFFRSVKPHVITQDDLDNDNMEKPTGTAVGDSGIVFVSDYNDTDDGDETLFFVPIKADVDVTGKFFREVESYTITEDDLEDDNISKPTDTIAGDTGLLFTSDNNETNDGDEKKFFVPIKVEKPDITDSINDNTSAEKIPTAAAVINYVAEVMQDKVSFEIDGETGVETIDGGLSFPGAYSEDEVRIGTWITGEPLYRKCFVSTTDPNSGGCDVGNIPNIIPINIYGIIHASDGSYVPANYGVDNGNWTFMRYASQESGNIVISYAHPNSIYRGRPITTIIEYIKKEPETN